MSDEVEGQKRVRHRRRKLGRANTNPFCPDWGGRREVIRGARKRHCRNLHRRCLPKRRRRRRITYRDLLRLRRRETSSLPPGIYSDDQTPSPATAPGTNLMTSIILIIPPVVPMEVRAGAATISIVAVTHSLPSLHTLLVTMSALPLRLSLIPTIAAASQGRFPTQRHIEGSRDPLPILALRTAFQPSPLLLSRRSMARRPAPLYPDSPPPSPPHSIPPHYLPPHSILPHPASRVAAATLSLRMT